MSKILVVVDMQKDFIDGALGTAEAEKIVDGVIKRIDDFDGEVVFTMDTHSAIYLQTQEGKNLPVPHCIKGTDGWKLDSRIEPLSKYRKIFEMFFIFFDGKPEKGFLVLVKVSVCTGIERKNAIFFE